MRINLYNEFSKTVKKVPQKIAVYDGDTKTGSLMSGQTCGQLTSIRPVKEILSDLFE